MDCSQTRHCDGFGWVQVSSAVQLRNLELDEIDSSKSYTATSGAQTQSQGSRQPDPLIFVLLEGSVGGVGLCHLSPTVPAQGFAGSKQ